MPRNRHSCSLNELIYTDADGKIKSRKPAPSELAKEIAFLPGKANYLGDFFAATSTQITGNWINRKWEVDPVRDHYGRSTAELKKEYPAFDQIPTEKTLLGR